MNFRENQLNESQIRKWRTNEDKLKEALEKEKWMQTPKSVKNTQTVKARRFRVAGGGRKNTNEFIEEGLFQWIIERRDEKKQVSRKSIQEKARKMFEASGSEKAFVASNGWCQNFMKRFNLSTRQKTNQSQRLPDELIPKVVSFFMYLRKYYANNEVPSSQVTAMDETCVHLENISNRIVSVAGKMVK